MLSDIGNGKRIGKKNINIIIFAENAEDGKIYCT